MPDAQALNLNIYPDVMDTSKVDASMCFTSEFSNDGKPELFIFGKKQNIAGIEAGNKPAEPAATLSGLALEVEKLKASDPTYYEKIKSEVIASRAVVNEIVAAGGVLDQYFETVGVDPKTARVWHYGSSNTGKSGQYKSFFHLEEKPDYKGQGKSSDIDLFVYANKKDGSKFELPAAGTLAFSVLVEGKKIEVQIVSGNIVGGSTYLNEIGAFVDTPPSTVGIPLGSRIVRGEERSDDLRETH